MRRLSAILFIFLFVTACSSLQKRMPSNVADSSQYNLKLISEIPPAQNIAAYGHELASQLDEMAKAKAFDEAYFSKLVRFSDQLLSPPVFSKNFVADSAAEEKTKVRINKQYTLRSAIIHHLNRVALKYNGQYSAETKKEILRVLEGVSKYDSAPENRRLALLGYITIVKDFEKKKKLLNYAKYSDGSHLFNGSYLDKLGRKEGLVVEYKAAANEDGELLTEDYIYEEVKEYLISPSYGSLDVNILPEKVQLKDLKFQNYGDESLSVKTYRLGADYTKKTGTPREIHQLNVEGYERALESAKAYLVDLETPGSELRKKYAEIELSLNYFIFTLNRLCEEGLRRTYVSRCKDIAWELDGSYKGIGLREAEAIADFQAGKDVAPVDQISQLKKSIKDMGERLERAKESGPNNRVYSVASGNSQSQIKTSQEWAHELSNRLRFGEEFNYDQIYYNASNGVNARCRDKKYECSTWLVPKIRSEKVSDGGVSAAKTPSQIYWGAEGGTGFRINMR